MFLIIFFFLFLFFFFQAEDGIRDYKVTGVQTCALPISRPKIDFTPSPHLRHWALTAAKLTVPIEKTAFGGDRKSVV